MKSFKIYCILFLTFVGFKYFAQTTCATSQPFCASSNYSFPASTGNTSTSTAGGPNYGCLFTQPNPAWYYVQISQSGPVIFAIGGTGGGDVDFICWGPFSSSSGNCGNLTSGNTVDCSYSASATETCTIPNAIAGEYYQVLITNYSNQVQNITFNQGNSSNTGAGSTNCNFTSGVTSQSICPTKTATLVASTSLLNPTFAWSPGGLTTQTITVNPSLTTVYTVSITGNVAASGTPTTIVNTGTVTVLSSPTVNLSSNSAVCPGSAIFLSATSGFTNYVWTTPTGSLSSVADNISIPNATTSLAGTYSVSVNSLQGCAGTGTTNVSLITTAPVTTTVPATACEGGTVALNAIAAGAVSYSWTGPAGYTSTLQNPVLNNVTLAQMGIYTVTASFTGTIGTNTCTTVSTTTVTVIPASTVALTPLATICSNGVINLSAPAGGNSYNWTGPNSFVSNLQNPVVNNAEVINEGVYSVSITASGCVRTGSITVDVYDPLSFSSVPTDVTLCSGNTANLTSSGTGGSGNLNYTWNPINDLSSPNTSATSVTGNTTTQYTVTLSDASCAVTQTVSTVVTVSVNPTPTITLGANLRGCEPYEAPLESISNPPSASCSWIFSNSSAYGQCSTPVGSGFLFPAHGVYDATLSVVDVNGCPNSISQTAYVTVDPKPQPDFTYLPTNPTILINEVNFTDDSEVGTPMQDWHWNFGDWYVSEVADTANVPNPSHVYDNAATYTVSLAVTNKFGCKDTVTKFVIVEDEFAIYIPNAFTPTKSEGKNDMFTPQGMGFLMESFQMSIYDRWGTQIYKTNDINKGWDGSVKGSGKAEQGVYIYKIRVTDFKKHEREFIGHVTLL